MKQLVEILFVLVKHNGPHRGKEEAVKIKIEQLLEKQAAFDKLLKKDLPFKLAYRLSKLATKVTQEMKHIAKAREDVIKKFGNKETNGSYKVPEDKLEAFGKEWEVFVQEEIEFSAEKIPMEALEKVELSAMDIANLDCFIEEEKKKEEAKPETKKE